LLGQHKAHAGGEGLATGFHALLKLASRDFNRHPAHKILVQNGVTVDALLKATPGHETRSVFISHAGPDKQRLGPLVRALKEEVSVFIDRPQDIGIVGDPRVRGIPGGANAQAFMKAELDRSDCVIAVWSKISVSLDQHAVMKDEAETAKRAGKLLGIAIDGVTQADLPLGFQALQLVLVELDKLAGAKVRFLVDEIEKVYRSHPLPRGS
jgi:hypothetical protein